MFRAIVITLSGCLLSGCQSSEDDKVVEKDKGFYSTSFSETVSFPLETVLPENPILDVSCAISHKIVPIYLGNEFISFDYQKCDSYAVTTVVDNGSVEIIWELNNEFGKSSKFTTPPLIIETGNIKPPEEYIDNLYTTDGERRYCIPFEKSTGIWEIKNVGYSPIPDLPTNFFDNFVPPIALSNDEKSKLRFEMASKYYAERDKKYDHQIKINRTCEKLPLAAYLFFQGEYILIMPKYYQPILDISSIRYHRK